MFISPEWGMFRSVLHFHVFGWDKVFVLPAREQQRVVKTSDKKRPLIHYQRPLDQKFKLNPVY
jgi:hypothetical protein